MTDKRKSKTGETGFISGDALAFWKSFPLSIFLEGGWDLVIVGIQATPGPREPSRRVGPPLSIKKGCALVMMERHGTTTDPHVELLRC